MDERQIRRQLIDWMIDFVEKPNPLLSNWPPCPYARQARLQNKIETFFIHDVSNIDSFIREKISVLDNYDVLIFCIDPKKINGTDLADQVNKLNLSLCELDYILLEDHPEIVEVLNGVAMNFNHCALIFAQKLSKLQDASKQLQSKGYYDHWPKENLDYVVNWRNK